MQRISQAASALVIMLILTLMMFNWYRHLLSVTSYSSSSSSCSNSSSSSLTQGKVHVLLLSSWRSGSSFLGQTFGQHPSVFYLMEPAWHVWTRFPTMGAQSLRMAVRDLLRQVLLCDLSVMDSYMQPEPRVEDLFFWSHSRALCSPPACPLTPRGNFSVAAECLAAERCGIGRLSKAEEACRSYSHVVLKEVRLFELESLFPLLRDPTLDLRIVHLVRDPRAVWRSRHLSPDSFVIDNDLVLEHSDVKGVEAEYRVLREICRSHVRMLRTAQLKPPDFLRGRYKIVRYEDMVLDPLVQVEDIYRFVGLEMTQQMQDWIHLLTQGKSSGTGPFHVDSRNAVDVMRAWRTTLPHENVQRVQGVCQDAMALLGYRAVDSEEEQHQLDLEVLLSPPREDLSWQPSKSTNRTRG